MTLETENRIGLPPSFMIKASMSIFLACVLSGCTSGSLDLFEGAGKVDRSISTATVPKPSQENVSDQVTIVNAVTSTDLAKLGHSPLPWANTSTGSAGVVSQINEDKNSGVTCRSFITTRHAFDGIAKFYGKACLDGAGRWTLLSFDHQS